MIFTKGAHQIAKLQTFDCSGGISPNLYFDSLLLQKVYKVSAKKSMEELCLLILKSGAKFEEKLIFCFENDKNLVNFDLSTKNSKKFSLWLVPFVQSMQRLTWKSTEELQFMTLKSHAKFEEKLTCGLENDMNLANFHQNTWKYQNWYFHGILLSKVENAWATNLQRTYNQWHWRMMKNAKRNWLDVSKLTQGIWWILTRELQSPKNLHFNGLPLTKLNNVWAKKVQRSYVWLHSRLIQSLKENWFVLPKIDMRNLANFNQSIWKSLNWDLNSILLSKVENV